MIKVEVVYATPEQQHLIEVNVLPNANIEDAIYASGLLTLFPDLNITTLKVGVFGKLLTLHSRLCDGDRVEIYRPLHIDPKQARRLRIDKAK